MNDRDLLALKDVKKYFPVLVGLLRRHSGDVRALDGINLTVRRGEAVGIVGESGCGKTTLGRCIMQLLPITSGSILYRFDSEWKDLAALSSSDRLLMRRKIQIIFQDTLSSLNPALTIASSFSDPMRTHGIRTRAERIVRIAELLESVGLPPDAMFRYPSAFSGGERQRVCIARALSVDPELLICDEAVSSLDVSIQAQMLNLLRKIQKERNLTYVFISHNLSIVEYISDRIAVMYMGKIVEILSADALTHQARHPYTRALLSALPVPTPDRIGQEPHLIRGDVPDPFSLGKGCRFYNRCEYRTAICQEHEPELTAMDHDPSHFVACHHAGR